ncbi:MAG: hypothetical protein ACKO38_01985 [Planctomycetota bacterium]
MDGVDVAALWRFLPIGYLASVAFESPVLWLGLSPVHSPRRRLFAAFWLTAATYPIVALLLPTVVEPRWGRVAYVAIAEIFAPLAECLLFALAFHEEQGRDSNLAAKSLPRDMAAIVLANLVSFLVGGWFVDLWL